MAGGCCLSAQTLGSLSWNIDILDITVLWDPARLTGGTLQQIGSDYTSSFEDDRDGLSRYIALVPDRGQEPFFIKLDLPSFASLYG